MSTAIYNATGKGGRPTISPATDGRLSSAVVSTRVGEAVPVREEYALVGLSGRGSRVFGLQPAEIVWELEFIATIGDLVSFEDDMREYERDPVRTDLSDEKGQSWNYVELAQYRRLEIRRTATGPKYWVRAEVRFKWMQP